MTEEQRLQIFDQCNAIAHLAKAIASVHSRIAGLANSSATIPQGMGKDTAELMETLGDILNGMESVTEEDKWLDPIFEKAQTMWKQDA